MGGNREFLWTSIRTGNGQVFVVDGQSGDTVNIGRGGQAYDRYPSWSPDGRSVAFTSDRDGAFNLFLADADGGNLRQLTHEKPPVIAGMQSWTADGRWIYFGLFQKGAPQMCRLAPDGSGFEVLRWGVDPAVSPDGKLLAYAKDYEAGHVLCVANVDGSVERPLTAQPNPFAGVHATWTPDGSAIVYADGVGQGLELFACGPDGSGKRQLTSFGMAATSPAVSPDGRFITFRLCDEVFWRDESRMRKAYGEKRADLRPVWMMKMDGSDPHAIELLRYQTTIDGSRVPIRPNSAR